MILLRIFAIVVTLPLLAIGALLVALIFLLDVACGEYEGWTLGDLMAFLKSDTLETRAGNHEPE